MTQIITGLFWFEQITVAARSKDFVCGHLPAEIAASNTAGA
jgi:hypothetical protein